MQKKGSLLTLPLNAFPSSAVSCCPVTRCRGRQVYLVWQVTLHPGLFNLMSAWPWCYANSLQLLRKSAFVFKYIIHLDETFPWVINFLFSSLQEPTEAWVLPGHHLYGCLGWLLCCYPCLLDVRFQIHPKASPDGLFSWWDRRSLWNTNHRLHWALQQGWRWKETG